MTRTSIRLRLMVMTILLTTLPVLTITWIATNNTRSSVESEIVDANTSRMLWVDQYAGNLLQQLDTVFYTLQADQQLVTSMNQIDSDDPGVQSTSEAYVRSALTTTFVNNSQTVDALSLYIHSEHMLYTVDSANSGAISRLDARSTPWNRMLKGPVNVYFRREAGGIFAFHSMNRFEDHKLFGGISVRLNAQAWEEIGTILNSGLGGSVLVFNDANQLLSGSATAVDLQAVESQLRTASRQDSALVLHRTARDLYIINTIEDGLLTVVRPIPLASIDQTAEPTIRAGILTGGIFAAVSILLSIAASLLISRPIVGLARLMRTTTISSYEMKPVNNRDEVGLLESAYHSMMQRIVELVDVEYRQELEIKNAQLLALQAQINPHFLNNVLNLVGGMALKRSAPEIYQVVLIVSKLLQYSVSSDTDMVSLGDELEHTRNYLFIQEERFSGRCTVSIAADDTALASRLPKFTLQPVVENAFVHGLQRKEGAWNVAVRVVRTGTRVCILVRDDGVGIPPDRLPALRAGLRYGSFMRPPSDMPVATGHGTGIGLGNVNSRLKLQFGGRFGVRLFSAHGAGTLVVIVIPAANSETARDV